MFNAALGHPEHRNNGDKHGGGGNEKQIAFVKAPSLVFKA